MAKKKKRQVKKAQSIEKTSAIEDKSARVSKREQRRIEMVRQQRRRSIIIWGSVVLVLVVLVGGWIYRLQEPDVEGVVFVEAAVGGDHDNDIRYEFGGLPPTGGTHNGTWQNCGIYTEPVRAEYAIHSMEHGTVWITYHPDLGSEEIGALQDMVRGSSYVILSPYPDQSEPIVMTTWDIQLIVDSVEDERIEQFINRYKGLRGPEAGASCSNGNGVPIG